MEKFVSCSNGISFRQGLRADNQSGDSVNGLPERENLRVETLDGDSVAEDILRDETESTVHRSLKHTEAYRQDKEGEELNAVARLLTCCNKVHGTDYEKLMHDDDDNETDVWAISKADEHISQAFQVTKCDCEPWKQLARAAQFDETLSEDELVQRFCDAVAAKKFSAFENIVLVLDGWPPINNGLLERLSNECSEQLRAIRFQEIWYSERGPGGQVCRISSSE